MNPKYRSSSSPGEILQKEFMIPFGYSSLDLAEKIRPSRNVRMDEVSINRIINGTKKIDNLWAQALAQEFNTTSEYWFNLQKNYDDSLQLVIPPPPINPDLPKNQLSQSQSEKKYRLFVSPSPFKESYIHAVTFN